MYSRYMTSTQSLGTLLREPASVPTRVLPYVGKAILCSCIIALGAQIEIRLPYTPVPITGQSLSIVISGLLFGRTLAIAGTAAYLLEGAAGLPVFSGGGAGLHHFAGPTGGYLLGFLPAAYIAGAAKDRGFTASPLGVFLTVLASSIPIFFLGVLRLWMVIGDLSMALSSGFFPFIPGDFMKALLASMLTPLATITQRKQR
jgi:biotin transport system substrate-specific component